MDKKNFNYMTSYSGYDYIYFENTLDWQMLHTRNI